MSKSDKICWTYLAQVSFSHVDEMILCKTCKAKQSKGYPGISRKSSEPGRQILLGRRHFLRKFTDTGREGEKKILGSSVGVGSKSALCLYLKMHIEKKHIENHVYE